jgi:hypothetical protein
MVPDRLRGRVIAVYSMMFMGMAPFGALFAGSLAERIGAPATVAAGGTICFAGAGIFSLRLPALRGKGRDLILAQELAGGLAPSTSASGRIGDPVAPRNLSGTPTKQHS